MALHRKAEERGFDLAAKGLRGFRKPERLAVAVSEQAHFSVRHAVRMLGLGEESLLRVPVDGRQRMDVVARDRDRAGAALSTAGPERTG